MRYFNPLSYLDIPDATAKHDDCVLYSYHFDTLDGPVEILAYTEADAIRRAEEQGFDVLDYWAEVSHG